MANALRLKRSNLYWMRVEMEHELDQLKRVIQDGSYTQPSVHASLKLIAVMLLAYEQKSKHFDMYDSCSAYIQQTESRLSLFRDLFTC